jgi:spore germination protein GerM
MNSGRAALIVGGALLVAIVTGLLLTVRPRVSGNRAATATNTQAGATTAEPGRTIKARLFFVSDDGMRLDSIEREIPYAEGAEQAREIINAQIAPAAPLLSAIPAGTMLRAVYITDRGDAYVDLSAEAVSAHPGGTQNELLTVYTIVDALTVNLPAVHAVQILIDGKEVETLAGHVDLRQPLAKNLGLVE